MVGLLGLGVSFAIKEKQLKPSINSSVVIYNINNHTDIIAKLKQNPNIDWNEPCYSLLLWKKKNKDDL